MATKANPEKVKSDVDKILGVWKGNTDFKIKDVTVEDFEKDNTKLDILIKQIVAMESDITPLRNSRDDLALKLQEICTRARSGIRGYFGPNSSQYEQVGGTRTSERKKPRRRSGNADSTNK